MEENVRQHLAVFKCNALMYCSVSLMFCNNFTPSEVILLQQNRAFWFDYVVFLHALILDIPMSFI